MIKHWARAIVLLLPAAALISLATPRLMTGLAVDETFPVPAAMSTGRSVGQEDYRRTARFLSFANSHDGDTQVDRAEALWLSGAGVAVVLPIITGGLSQSPASIRGWTLLAQILQKTEPKRAGEALAVALELSPYDYWLPGPKTRAGAPLWNVLPADARAQLVAQAGMLWSHDDMRPQILPLLEVPGGPELMTKAISDPNTIRAVNRYVSHMRLGLP